MGDLNAQKSHHVKQGTSIFCTVQAILQKAVSAWF